MFQEKSENFVVYFYGMKLNIFHSVKDAVN